MQAEAITHGMKKAAHLKLRPGMFGLDRLHDAAALFLATRIHSSMLTEFCCGKKKDAGDLRGRQYFDRVQRRYAGGIQSAQGWPMFPNSMGSL